MIEYLIDLKDTGNAKKWDEFVIKSLYGTPYHLTSWLITLEETYGFRPQHLCVTNSLDQIECVFPLFIINNFLQKKRAVSIPFSDYGGAISDTAEPLSQLFRIKDSLSKYRASNMEIRCLLPEAFGFSTVNNYFRHYLNLDEGINAIESKIDKKTIKYSIRKAKKNGVQVCEDNSESALNHFIRLNELTRAKHGVPAQPRLFFKNIYKNIIRNDKGCIFLANHDGKVTAASLFLSCGNKFHYKYSASDPSVIKSLSPNHLLTWTAIQYSIEKGFKEFDFGRTSTDNAGLLRYKRMWGGEEMKWAYSYFPDVYGASSIKESDHMYQTSIKLWNKLPNFIQRFVSSRIYKYFG